MDVLETLQTLTVTTTAVEREELKARLSIYLNYLLLTDFSSLVQLLYRVDVSEDKLKQELAAAHTSDAGDILADLLLTRHMEKLEAKKKNFFSSPIDDQEKW